MGPMNGATEKTAMGRAISLAGQISDIVPALTVRKTEPVAPAKKRDTSIVPMFLATAVGICQTINIERDPRYLQSQRRRRSIL